MKVIIAHDDLFWLRAAASRYLDLNHESTIVKEVRLALSKTTFHVHGADYKDIKRDKCKSANGATDNQNS